MIRQLDKFMTRLEARPHSLAGLVIVCTFTGIFRAIEEYIFFGEKLTGPMGISMIFPYFHIAIGLICLLQFTTQGDWKRIQNAVYLGIFLGIVPPLIDLPLNGFGATVTYRFFLADTKAGLPFHFYNPSIGVPLGETIVVWLSIIFSGCYALLKTRSLPRAILTWILTYLLMLVQFALVPLLAVKLVVGTSFNANLNTQQTAQATNLAMALMPFWYLLLSLVMFFMIRPVVLHVFLKRFLHFLPFALITIFGGAVTNQITGPVILAAASVLLINFSAALQNDYFDARLGEHAKIIEHSDMQFIHIICGAFLLWLLILNQMTVLPLIVLFSCGILYNYPQFRIKKFFPGALKIEGLAALMCFLTGVMIFDRSHFRPSLLVIALLVFGGWSVLSSWKDLKDIRSDVRLKYKNLYTFLMARGLSLSKAHRVSSTLGLACVLVPVCYALATGQWYAAGILLASGFLPLLALSYFPRIRKWFKYVLISVSAVEVGCILVLKI